MNQYDKISLHQEQQSQLRNGAIIALVAIALFFVSMLSGCAEKEPLPTPEEMIVGAWERKWLMSTDTYSFDGDGQCIKHAIIPGQPAQAYFCKYWFDQDTISMIDLSVSKPFRDTSRAVVTFTDSGNTAILSWLDGVDYYLRRI